MYFLKYVFWIIFNPKKATEYSFNQRILKKNVIIIVIITVFNSDNNRKCFLSIQSSY